MSEQIAYSETSFAALPGVLRQASFEHPMNRIFSSRSEEFSGKILDKNRLPNPIACAIMAILKGERNFCGLSSWRV